MVYDCFDSLFDFDDNLIDRVDYYLSIVKLMDIMPRIITIDEKTCCNRRLAKW